MATPSSILAWRIPMDWYEELMRLLKEANAKRERRAD